MKSIFKRKSQIPKRRSAEREVDAIATSDKTFRRNRTLVGTTSNKLDSTGAGDGLQSSRKHIHILSIRRRRVLSSLVVVFLSMLLIWTLICNFTATPKIVLNDLNITRPIDKNKYEKVIQDYLSVNPTNRLTFLLDDRSLDSYVSDKLPEVSNVTIKNMIGIGAINYAISLRKPVAGWKINDKQYYVDAKGIQFEENYFEVPKVQIIDQSGISTGGSTSSVAIASKRFLSFVGQVVALSKDRRYDVTEAVLPTGMTRELIIRLKGVKSRIKLSIDRPAGDQVEDMDNAIKYFESRGREPAYIDVRVSGKAYYK